MVAAVRVHKHGGPEVLTYEDVQVAARHLGQQVKPASFGHDVQASQPGLGVAVMTSFALLPRVTAEGSRWALNTT